MDPVEQHPARSLVQQRLEIDRMRSVGVFLTVAGVVALLGGLWLLTTTPSGPIVGLVVAVVLIVNGVRRQLAAKRRRTAFEAEHGVEAGVQHPRT